MCRGEEGGFGHCFAAAAAALLGFGPVPYPTTSHNATHNTKTTQRDRRSSPLENHHLAAAFTVLQQPDYNFAAALPKAQAERFRRVVIELVLATDMKQHFSILSHFTTVHRLGAAGSLTPTNGSSCPPQAAAAGGAAGAAHGGGGARGGGGGGGAAGAAARPGALGAHAALAHGHGGGAAGGLASSGGGSGRVSSSALDEERILLPLDENERLLSLQMALKCADVGHLTSSLAVHKR